MKKVLLTAAIFAAVFSGCASQGGSSAADTSSKEAETSAATVNTVGATEITEPVTEEKVPVIASGPPEDVWEMNKLKCVFFLGEDLFCYTEQGGRDSANFVLSRRAGDTFIPVDNGEDCNWRFSDGERIWGTHYSITDGNYEKRICYTDGITVTDTGENISTYEPYFTPEGVYYLKPKDEMTSLMLMSYTGEISEEAVLACGMPYRFQVYDGKLCCDKSNSKGVCVYDLSTGSCSEADIIEQPDEEYSYDGDSVYRNTASGSEPIFTAGELYDEPGYYIVEIQVSGDDIYVNICSGAFYSRIVRLDRTGAYIETIYESDQIQEVF